jgi:hypothetical protein
VPFLWAIIDDVPPPPFYTSPILAAHITVEIHNMLYYLPAVKTVLKAANTIFYQIICLRVKKNIFCGQK